MSAYQKSRGGKDQFDWDAARSDRDRDCCSGHSGKASTSRRQEGKDASKYSKTQGNQVQIKSAEFRAAKKLEEDALMAALGMKPLPNAVAAAVATPIQQQKPVIKRELQSTSVKNEPMTPAIHGDNRHGKHHDQPKSHDKKWKEDRRRRRQQKAAGSDEDKHDWSASEDSEADDDEEQDKDTKNEAAQPDLMTEKDLDEFLVDLVKKHGLRTIQRALKSKKDKKDRKQKHSSRSVSSQSESEDEKRESKQKHKKKHSHKEESHSSKRRRTRSPSSSKNDRSKRH
ncbi:unnamed protein product [Adineta ricciae]|uniref:Multiple myeloma tumor-associated protein 2-like N-terminal domain-containing protein n=1 Tax=Adineta ricciae TaxID=249248 RepID=A0A814IB86_ADIRI|nr:unnamed protein product [Adineta ricciae]CAF1322887.1 unnamed protein product [Adineta ricciae]